MISNNIPLLRRPPTISGTAAAPVRPCSAKPNDINHQFAELKLKEIEAEKAKFAYIQEVEKHSFSQKHDLIEK